MFVCLVFIVTTGGGTPGIRWVEARDAANILQCTGQPPPPTLQQKLSSPNVKVPRLRNSTPGCMRTLSGAGPAFRVGRPTPGKVKGLLKKKKKS